MRFSRVLRAGLGVVLSCGIAAANADGGSTEQASASFSAARALQLVDQFKPADLAAAGEHARYAYLNMGQFFPHQMVSRAGPVRVLNTAPRPSVGELRVTTALGNLSLEQMLKHPQAQVQGFVVVHRGAVVFERYSGMQARDAHLWWSVAKLFAGVLTELLIDEGRVQRDQNISAYLPELAGSGWDGASVDDVLNMASGVDAQDSLAGYMDPDSGIGRLILAEGVLAPRGHTPAFDHDEALRMIRSQGEPGRLYQYSSANTNVLGVLIERITGQRYSDVVSQRIWAHLGAEGDGLMGMAPNGRAIAHGMFSSRLRDLARFGLLFTPSGHNPDVLPQRVLARIGDTQRNAHYHAAVGVAAAHEQRLGDKPVNALAQWDGLFADGDLYKSGFDGQALYVSPTRDVVVAMFATSRDKSAYAYLRPVAQHFEAQAKPRACLAGGPRRLMRACPTP